MAKILLVDDSETLRAQLKNLLASKGHEVIEGSDGIKGLEALEKNSGISLIICDVNMPNMDGLKMVTTVSENPNCNKIPIFMLTTETSADLKEKSKKAGVKAWINKPYDDAKLLAVVEKVLSAA